MGRSILDGEDLILTQVPIYASNIIETKSNGLGGEIIISKEHLDFFGVSGNEVIIKNKKCLELNPKNRYMFDKNNLLTYMEDVKGEYISAVLFEYKSFKSEPWKNIDYLGWERRVKRIRSANFSKRFQIYIKKTNDNDPNKGARYYLAGLDSDEYSIIVKYCLIPQYTNIRIKKERNSQGGYNYIFLLEVNGLEDIKRILEFQYKEEESNYFTKNQDVLLKSARSKSDVAKNKQEGQTITTKVYKRDAEISAYVKMRADGKCDMCGERAPFIDKKGNPYLEEHHVIRLADGGEDSIDNAVALCPNCHRKIHIIGTSEMNRTLQNRIMAYAKLEERFLNQED